MGAVHLRVPELERSLSFYQDHLGFKIHRSEWDMAVLGAGGSDLLILNQDRRAQRSLGTTGLYHFAIQLPTRRDLANALRNIVETKTPVQGFADHHVSEAIYLEDPDQNGIEIYRDRPRDEWLGQDGLLKMGTDPLDVEGILSELGLKEDSSPKLPEQTKIGHVHLHVSHIHQDETFYRDVLGFDLMQRYGSSASFLSAGGYHHHIGINTWQGVGAPAPPHGSVGLEHFTILLPDQDELDRITERLKTFDHPFEITDEGILLRDPSDNGILLKTNI
jgi:catechol 2,3-dioxygenase